MRKTKFILAIPLLIMVLSLRAQEGNTDSITVTLIYKFSLQDAVNYALEHNVDMLNARLDITKAKRKVWETTAIGLPQVNGTVSFTDNLDLRTTLFPDFITQSVVGINTGLFGLTPVAPIPERRTMPVQFGSQYQASWGFTATQIIFNGEYIVGLQASRAFLEMSKNAEEKADLDTRQKVAQAYNNALVMNENVRLNEHTLKNMQKILSDMQAFNKQGLMDETDVQQMKLTVNNLKIVLDNLKIYKDISLKLLKLQTGLSLSDSLVLSDSLQNIVQNSKAESLLTQEFDINQMIEYKMLLNQEEIQNLSMKQQQSKVLPSLSAYYNFSKDAQRDSFNFFKTGDDYPWFKASSVGLQLKIPIFASGSRWSKIQQQKIELDKIRNKKENAEQAFVIQYEQNKANLQNSLQNFEHASENLKYAENIYNNTVSKYKAGTASSLNLAQAQNQYLNSQNQYFQAIIKLMNNKLALEKMFNIKK